MLILDVPSGGDCSGREFAIQAFDLTGQAAGPVIRLPDRSRELASLDPTLGVEAADGLVALGVNGRLAAGSDSSDRPYVVRLRDGQVLEAP